MPFTAEIFTSSIVVVGDFNPAIFSPDWLERNNLIGEGDATVAREGRAGGQLLVSHQVTSFETEWFALQVLENQFTLSSKGVLSPAFKDLAVGVFQLVPQTPVRAIGLNFIGQFKLSTLEEQHKIGDVFAPKDIWNTLYPEEFYAGLENLTMRIQHGSREKGADSNDEKRITLQRTNRFKYGVSLSFNDHHDLTVGNNDLSSAERLAIIIDDQLDPCWADAVRVFNQLLSIAMDQ